ncbi:hypothetical protein [uncultured Sphingomonas sp.]|uniref:hypothetical protein n=1 Tax=uncultured Sphingomonas sp. TaxID=158754 RepID=UPI0026133E11|nr:hypothetical protein [uncultured Sphingomonas sp.]
MATSYRHYNVRLERAQWDRLSVIATEQKLSVADVIRSALNVFLSSSDVLTASQRRLARISEFQQLVLDVILREQYPELRDRLVAETDKRLVQYHGA